MDSMRAQMLTVLLVLLGFGLLALNSASAALAGYRFGVDTWYLHRQAGWIVLGLVAMFAVSRIDYHRYHRLGRPALLLSLLFLLILVLPFTQGIAPEINGARRWIIYPFRFQPSEMVRFSLVLWASSTIARKGEKIHDLREGVLPPVVVMGVAAALIVLEPDLSTTALCFSVVMLLLFLGRARIAHLLVVCGVFLALFLLTVYMKEYSLDRVLSIFFPDQDPLNRDYHLNQCRIALGSGGWIGRGIGNGLQKYFFLPEPHTDSLPAAIGEEFGFVGMSVLLLVYLYLGVLGYRVMMRCHDLLGFLLVGGVFASILLPLILSVGVNMGVLPSAGIGLPFISYGGSSMVVMLAGFGVVLNVMDQNRTGVRRMRRRL